MIGFMIDYAQARKNMVDCQIHTSGVVHDGLLTSFETIPREDFVSDSLKSVAYYDEKVELDGGRSLLPPMVLSKMLEAANPVADDYVLDIGGGTGYGAAILSPIVSMIVAVESKPYLQRAAKIWSSLDVCNVVEAESDGDIVAAAGAHAPYSLIVLHGAVEFLPDAVKRLLAPGGRMVCVIRKAGDTMGQATLIQAVSVPQENGGDASSLGKVEFSSYTLFECAADYLDGFAPKPAFCFS